MGGTNRKILGYSKLGFKREREREELHGMDLSTQGLTPTYRYLRTKHTEKSLVQQLKLRWNPHIAIDC